MTILRLRLKNPEEVRQGIKVSESAARAIGVRLKSQVERRFESSGATGGIRWSGKAFDDGRAILTGKSAGLRKSFKEDFAIEGEKTRIWIISEVPYARVHQLGTRGKGGELPDIVPVKAKALFIPLTDRARMSQRAVGAQAVVIAGRTGRKTISPIRAAVTGRKQVSKLEGEKEAGVKTFTPLKKGRIHKGQMQVWDERKKKYVDGKPDFIFLKKVSVPARPMLPESEKEQDDIRLFAEDMLNGGSSINAQEAING